MKTSPLFTHKGTPVRLALTLNSGEVLLIHPLRHEAIGLLLKPLKEGANFGLAGDYEEGKIHLLGGEGYSVFTIEINDSEYITGIESFVIYPDGTTWRGNILEGQENKVSLMVWSTDLAQQLNSDISQQFVADSWEQVPTIVSVIDDEIKGDCTRISHSCGDCDKSSKLTEI